jgi:hypothetical protein
MRINKGTQAIASMAIFITVSCAEDDKSISTQRYGLTGPQPVSFSFPAGFGPDNVAVGASQSLRLAPEVSITDASGAPGPVVNMGTQDTEIGVQANTGPVTAGGFVRLGNRARVSGSVTAAGRIEAQQGAVVSGGMNPLTPVSVGTEIRWNVAWPASHQGHVRLEPDRTRALAPGAYGDLDVKSRATITLAPGTYFFDSVMLHPQSRLVISSAEITVIHVARDLTHRASLAAPGGPGSLLFVVLGQQTVIESEIVGTVLAPHGTIMVQPPGRLVTGALYGANVRIEPRVVVKHAGFAWDSVTELIVTGNTGPQQGTRVEGTGPDKGNATFPGPGTDPKLAPDQVVVPTADEIRGRFGTAAKNVEVNLPDPVGTGPLTGRRFETPSGSYARVLIELSAAGLTPRHGRRITDGPLVRSETVDGPLLVVVDRDNAPEHLVSLPDPRTNVGAAPIGFLNQGHSLGGNSVSSLRISLPEAYTASRQAISSIQLRVYAMADTVSRNTHVTLDNLAALLQGSSLLGTLSGNALLPFFFESDPGPIIK